MRIKKLVLVGVIILGLLLIISLMQLVILWGGDSVVAEPEPRPQPQPPAPVAVNPFLRTDNVLRVTSESAYLAGSVDPRGTTPLAVWFEYGEGGDLLDRRTTEFLVDSPGDFVWTVFNLRPDKKYFFRVTARGPGEKLFHGEVRSFMTDF